MVRKELDESFLFGYVGFLKEVFSRLHMKNCLFLKFRGGENFVRGTHDRPGECSKIGMFVFLLNI